jgi:hypothetical protein
MVAVIANQTGQTQNQRVSLHKLRYGHILQNTVSPTELFPTFDCKTPSHSWEGFVAQRNLTIYRYFI